MNTRRQKDHGFTVIELLVVIAIIGLLSSVVVASLNSTRKKARDAKRRTDFKQIQVALELYQDTVGSYPSTSTSWWGNCSTYGSHGTSGTTGWIPDLAPAYILVLPLDPRPVGTDGCYLYMSNGVDYKLLTQTIETTSCPPMPPNDGMYDPVRSGIQCAIGLYTPGAATW